MDFSNFISKFNASSNNTDSSNIDIMTTVSNSIQLQYSNAGNPSIGGPYYGRYFCVGNLLVQFSDFSTQAQDPSAISLSSNGPIYILSFPNPYETIPYCVIPYVVRLGYETVAPDFNFGAVATLTYMTEQNFSFRLAAYPAGIGFLSIGPRPSFYNTPPPFYTTGGGVQYIPATNSNYSYSYYVISFYSNGSITFTSPVYGASMICVGGGGGGGSGITVANYDNTNHTGRGGGGGGSWQLNNQTLTVGTYNITVGAGGLGGTIWSVTSGNPGPYTLGNQGGPSSIYTIDPSETIISCSGGGGGGSGGTTNNNGGIGGTVTVPSGVTGNGGGGGTFAADGSNNTIEFDLNIPTNVSYYIQSNYGGGGAGGNSSGGTGYDGGGAGVNGIGGSVEGSSNYNGQNAITYGSGGGGASFNSSAASNTSYSGGNGDDGLVVIYFPYPTPPYLISDLSGISVTTINNNGYTGLIFESTLGVQSPGSTVLGNGTCNIQIFIDKEINVLVVGSGGGAASGYFSGAQPGPGGGGGGGGGYILDLLPPNISAYYNIQVGTAGGGRKSGDTGAAGNNGYKSFITADYLNLNLIGGGGGAGFGNSTTTGYGGGLGGNSTNSLNDTGGGGGGGGGGAGSTYSGAYNKRAPTAGALNTSYNKGNLGGNGSTASPSYYGGTGGDAYQNYIDPPFLSGGNIYFGNGGGGGSGEASGDTGGKAGSTTGGTGYGSSSGNGNGEDAITGSSGGNYYYGNGGGGGGQSLFGTIYGGNGASGVVILWWEN
jgi:hypothetical protein